MLHYKNQTIDLIKYYFDHHDQNVFLFSKAQQVPTENIKNLRLNSRYKLITNEGRYDQYGNFSPNKTF